MPRAARKKWKSWQFPDSFIRGTYRQSQHLRVSLLQLNKHNQVPRDGLFSFNINWETLFSILMPYTHTQTHTRAVGLEGAAGHWKEKCPQIGTLAGCKRMDHPIPERQWVGFCTATVLSSPRRRFLLQWTLALACLPSGCIAVYLTIPLFCGHPDCSSLLML